jgi:predicted outer membrane repeat protein
LDGGGGLNNSGEATLGNSTVNSNSAREVGGGIRNTGMLALANVTISGNSAIEHGGGIYTFDTRATVHLANVTIVNNRADSDGDGSGGGGGIAVQSSIARFKNTLLGGNRAAAGMGADCSGTLTSQGYNLIQVGTGCTVAGNRTGNLLGRDPRIDPLANNGGSTFTHALRSNSPAINTGNPAGCTDKDGTFLRFDQRGVERPQGKACDIGAYERQVAQ